ncbi:MAG TPA: TetR/AcrR family transcriptional regulator [Pseudomonas sp.]|nr:TetR/AcrR family transcriptional regulator [Pseudomonas sp.]
MHGKGFGNRNSKLGEGPKPRTKPLKRPRQARAVFTVEAIYQAFVRILQRDGWDAVTTRSVAMESGFAVGTLYEYFPSKEALLSGYVRHCIEQLLQLLDQQVVAPELDWQQRITRLLWLSCGPQESMYRLFTFEMARQEAQVAEPKHHLRAYQELLAKWQEVFAACGDLPAPVSAATVEALFLMVWGGRRYAALAQLDEPRLHAWLSETERLILHTLRRP